MRFSGLKAGLEPNSWVWVHMLSAIVVLTALLRSSAHTRTSAAAGRGFNLARPCAAMSRSGGGGALLEMCAAPRMPTRWLLGPAWDNRHGVGRSCCAPVDIQSLAPGWVAHWVRHGGPSVAPPAAFSLPATRTTFHLFLLSDLYTRTHCIWVHKKDCMRMQQHTQIRFLIICRAPAGTPTVAESAWQRLTHTVPYTHCAADTIRLWGRSCDRVPPQCVLLLLSALNVLQA